MKYQFQITQYPTTFEDQDSGFNHFSYEHICEDEDPTMALTLALYHALRISNSPRPELVLSQLIDMMAACGHLGDCTFMRDKVDPLTEAAHGLITAWQEYDDKMKASVKRRLRHEQI